MKKTSLVSVAVVATLAAIVPFLRGERLPPAQPPAHPTTAMASAEGNRLLGRLPNAFVPNLGQWEHPARYVARVGRMTMFLDAKGWWFTLVEGNAAQTQCDASAPALGVAVRMTFVGAGTADLVAEEPLPGRHNYFLGNDASKWRSDVPLYSAVRYREVHPGVDVRAREQDGHFEYDLLLQPGADLDPIEIGVEGIERMYVDHEGTLVMETRLGPVRMPAPLTWEEGPSGEKSPVACRYVLRGDNRFGFVAPGRRPGWSMVVDPGLVWSTFLGGSGGDESKTLALDSSGRVTIGGVTGSTNFPTTLGAWSTTLISNGQADIFITRLTPAGDALDYSTFVGGAGADWVMSLAVDAQGSTTLAGSTSSVNFPTTLTAYDTTFNGGTSPVDGFVTRLAPSGASLAFSTFLGGSADADAVRALAVDAQGATTVCGDTWSNDFPTTPGAF